jgi:hypothetical protein
MGFCDRDAVRRTIEGKFIALVGSGPGILMNPPGFVDSHEVIVRVNNYALTGPITGKRTDIHYSFYGTSIRKRVDELKRDGVKLCIAKCPNAKFIDSPWHERRGKTRGVDFRYIYEERKDWWFCDTYVPTVEEFMEHFHLLGDHVPTTGFAALLTVLQNKPANVFVTGFDFFQSGIHNVSERWKPANPDDPIGHVPDAERAWFAENFPKLPITMDETLAAAISRRVRPQPQRRVHRFRRVTPA